MIHTFKMAFRNLRRNKRRSIFSALAVGVGLALLLFIAAFIEGEMRNSIEMAIKLQSGHFQVRAASYDEAKSSLAWEDLIKDPDQVAAQISTLSQVMAATPRLYANGIVSSGNQTVGVRIVGIDPASAANEPYSGGLTAGEFLTADDREGILIGKPLAESLALRPGDKISLLVNTSNGEVDEQIFTIRGVYSTRTPTYDETTVFIPLAKAQAITQVENRASLIFVLLKDNNQVDPVVDALQTEYQVLTWQQMNEILIQTEEMANGFIYLFYLIVLAITSTVVINTLIMSVFERTREIGILAAIGMRGGKIMGLFFAESSFLAVGGIAIGLILGSILVAYFSKFGIPIGDFGTSGILFGERIYLYQTMSHVITLTLLTFFITLLAALYPAILAARLEPVEALHSGQ